MEVSTVLGLTAAAELIKQSFLRVFDGTNLAAEAAFQAWKVRSLSRDRFADHVVRSVGTFPLFGTNKQANVDTTYVQITLSSDLERDRYKSKETIAAGIRRQRQGIVGNDARALPGVTLLEAAERTDLGVALIGLPGSGKTTALRHLVLTLAKGEALRGRRVLPLYFAVREMSVSSKGVIESAVDYLSWLEVPDSKRVVEVLMRNGGVALFVDGLDEVDHDYQVQLLDELTRIRTHFKDVFLCISARPHSLDAGLQGFIKYETLPLAMTERKELVTKWFAAVDEAKGQKLLTECAGDPSLLELGSNPLLLALICALYYNDLKIPQEPDELYARMVEGLLGAWDAFRNIARHTVLKDYSVRRRIMITSGIAAATFGAGKIVFSPADIESLASLRRFAESTRDHVIDARALLGSLYNDFGILVERAPGIFSFSHLTLQEYLTAQHIVDNRRELELVKRFSDHEWREVIRLVAKMLPVADDYLAKLTESVDVASRYDTELLALLWGAKPVCEPSRAQKIMTALASRTIAIIQNLGATYSYAGDTLVVNVNGLEHREGGVNVANADRIRARDAAVARRRRAERPIAVHHNLPFIVAALRSCSGDLGVFGLGRIQPFGVIRIMDDLANVRVVGEGV
ncbi:MAG TPA: NACHT domain-containing protein [Thermoanaerobaculia bacterium]|jgi:hypothetical protein